MCLPECGLSRHMRSGDLWLCVGAFHGIDFIIYYNTSIDSRQLATCCRLWLFHLLFERSQKKTSSLVSDSETTHWRQPMIDCENLTCGALANREPQRLRSPWRDHCLSLSGTSHCLISHLARLCHHNSVYALGYLTSLVASITSRLLDTSWDVDLATQFTLRAGRCLPPFNEPKKEIVNACKA